MNSSDFFMQLKIDRNVPIPPDRKKNNGLKEIIYNMNVGDSILGFQLKVTNIKRLFPEREYTQRKEGDKIRVWRIK